MEKRKVSKPEGMRDFIRWIDESTGNYNGELTPARMEEKRAMEFVNDNN